MRSNEKEILYRIDWTLIAMYIMLVATGLISIYSSSSGEETIAFFDFSKKHGKQIIWILASLFLFILIIFSRKQFFRLYSPIIYFVSTILLAGLFVVGHKVNGARSWYSIPGFSLQPSEFAKFATALMLSYTVSDVKFNLNKNEFLIKSFAIIFVPAFLVILQPDPGSGLIYLAFVFMLFREGLSKLFLIIGITILLIFITTLYFDLIVTFSIVLAIFAIALFFNFKNKIHVIQIIFISVVCLLFAYSIDFIFNNILSERHRNRINLVLSKVENTGEIRRTFGYNLDKSMTTIGSGDLFGKGFLKGNLTQGKFVPENTTDYIFCSIAEQWGFIGSSFVIILFSIFVMRILHRAERHKDKFIRSYGYSVAMIFFMHFFINLSMTVGLLPTIGVPLPFMSYGGSSMLGFSILIFIFIKLDSSYSKF